MKNEIDELGVKPCSILERVRLYNIVVYEFNRTAKDLTFSYGETTKETVAMREVVDKTNKDRIVLALLDKRKQLLRDMIVDAIIMSAEVKCHKIRAIKPCSKCIQRTA